MIRGLDLPRIDTGSFDFGGKRAPTGRWDAPAGWRAWLTKHPPDAVRAGFAPRHDEFWEWQWEIEPDSDPCPFVAIWPHGGGKSTGAAAGRKTHRSHLYVGRRKLEGLCLLVIARRNV